MRRKHRIHRGYRHVFQRQNNIRRVARRIKNRQRLERLGVDVETFILMQNANVYKEI